MTRLRIRIYSGLVLFLCLVGNGHAATLLIGEWGVGPFDSFNTVSVQDIFASPGMSDFMDLSYTSVFGWSATFVSAKQVTASGVERDTLAWNYHILDALADSVFSFDIYGYHGNTLIDWATVSYNGGLNSPGDQSISKLSFWDNYKIETHVVPEPSTFFLVVFGIFIACCRPASTGTKG